VLYSPPSWTKDSLPHGAHLLYRLVPRGAVGEDEQLPVLVADDERAEPERPRPSEMLNHRARQPSASGRLWSMKDEFSAKT
jgi:hypothetical protein